MYAKDTEQAYPFVLSVLPTIDPTGPSPTRFTHPAPGAYRRRQVPDLMPTKSPTPKEMFDGITPSPAESVTKTPADAAVEAGQIWVHSQLDSVTFL
jgi:hypothetical protein